MGAMLMERLSGFRLRGRPADRRKRSSATPRAEERRSRSVPFGVPRERGRSRAEPRARGCVPRGRLARRSARAAGPRESGRVGTSPARARQGRATSAHGGVGARDALAGARLPAERSAGGGAEPQRRLPPARALVAAVVGGAGRAPGTESRGLMWNASCGSWAAKRPLQGSSRDEHPLLRMLVLAPVRTARRPRGGPR